MISRGISQLSQAITGLGDNENVGRGNGVDVSANAATSDGQKYEVQKR